MTKKKLTDVQAIYVTIKDLGACGDWCRYVFGCETVEGLLRGARHATDGFMRKWVGRRLIQHGILTPPKVPRRECGFTAAHRCYPSMVLGAYKGAWDLPSDLAAEWYFPTDLLVWGCHEYVRRKGLVLPHRCGGPECRK